MAKLSTLNTHPDEALHAELEDLRYRVFQLERHNQAPLLTSQDEVISRSQTMLLEPVQEEDEDNSFNFNEPVFCPIVDVKTQPRAFHMRGSFPMNGFSKRDSSIQSQQFPSPPLHTDYITVPTLIKEMVRNVKNEAATSVKRMAGTSAGLLKRLDHRKVAPKSIVRSLKSKKLRKEWRKEIKQGIEKKRNRISLMQTAETDEYGEHYDDESEMSFDFNAFDMDGQIKQEKNAWADADPETVSKPSPSMDSTPLWVDYGDLESWTRVKEEEDLIAEADIAAASYPNRLNHSTTADVAPSHQPTANSVSALSHKTLSGYNYDYSRPSILQDPDESWKEKVVVSAADCDPDFKDVEYSPPPFPFKQYWHRQKKEMRPRRVY